MPNKLMYLIISLAFQPMAPKSDRLTVRPESGFEQPPPRHLEEIAFDIKRNKLVLFGGAQLIADGFIEPSYISEWDGFNWNKIATSGPVGRRGHSLIYHNAEEKMLLIGGVTVAGNTKDSLLFDVWSWDGKNWKNLNADCPLKNPEAAYDAVEKRILVYGDASDKTQEFYGKGPIFQLWEYKKNKWKKLADEGPKPDGPYEIAYQIKARALVIPEWKKDKDLVVWQWINGQWKKSDYTDHPRPEQRNRFGLAYSPDENAVFLFGGKSAAASGKSLNDFWKWDGTNWIKIEAAVTPPARVATSLEYANHCLLLYGGVDGTLKNDLWLWKNKKWDPIIN